MSGPAIVYPAGPATPHGIYHLLKGDEPEVSLQSYNDAVVFFMMGGRSHADVVNRPECVLIERDSLTGLIGPWQAIDQQGATEDGVTFVDALHDPIEVTLKAICIGRDAKHTRQVSRHLIESIDIKYQSEFAWMTPELGYWWAPVRWFKTPPDSFSGIDTRQVWTLVLRADSGFWQSYPDVDQFSFNYNTAQVSFGEFETDYPTSMGPFWPQRYNGDGGGYFAAIGGTVRWVDAPDDTFTTKSTEVVCGPYDDGDFSGTATDNQVIGIEMGAMPEWSLRVGGSIDIWGRMNRNLDGTWAGAGIRARVQFGIMSLTAFVDFVPVWTREIFSGPALPYIGDGWSLVCGYTHDPRLFAIQWAGNPVLVFKEPGTDSLYGPNYRGVGVGAAAGGVTVSQAIPATLRRVFVGDNTTVSQTGFLTRRNAGDQDAYDEYTLYGPATKFKIANGPGSQEMIEFGPLGVGEIAHIRTDPRKKGVFDLTNASTIGDTAPALFGASPSDTMYRKMNGRFTSACAIPAKQPGMRVEDHLVACAIEGGNADSKILAQLTPLRRYPQ